MTLNGPLKTGDRIVITVLPDGYVYHVETREGAIRAKEPKARRFEGTVAQIRADGCVRECQLL